MTISGGPFSGWKTGNGEEAGHVDEEEFNLQLPLISLKLKDLVNRSMLLLLLLLLLVLLPLLLFGLILLSCNDRSKEDS